MFFEQCAGAAGQARQASLPPRRGGSSVTSRPSERPRGCRVFRRCARRRQSAENFRADRHGWQSDCSSRSSCGRVWDARHTLQEIPNRQALMSRFIYPPRRGAISCRSSIPHRCAALSRASHFRSEFCRVLDPLWRSTARTPLPYQKRSVRMCCAESDDAFIWSQEQGTEPGTMRICLEISTQTRGFSDQRQPQPFACTVEGTWAFPSQSKP